MPATLSVVTLGVTVQSLALFYGCVCNLGLDCFSLLSGVCLKTFQSEILKS